MGQARELMDRATEAIMRQDFEALRDIYAPDVVVIAPDVGTLHGVEQLIDYMKQFSTAMPDMRFELHRGIEADDSVVDQGEVLGTNTGPLAMPDGSSLPATGKQVRMRSLDVATVENGRISKHEFYFDQLELMSQLGLMEAPAKSQPQ